MTFTDQWANRHDGECEVESYVKSYGGLRPIYVDCHCYRRWLEARLGEVESKLRGAVQAFDAADAIAVREKRRADDLARRLDILAQGMAGLLPPKGAGDEK
jgi:hypothetical protein